MLEISESEDGKEKLESEEEKVDSNV